MKRTQRQHRPKIASRAIPIRASLDRLAAWKEMAESHGMTLNGFLVRALDGIMEMIQAPDGKITVPEIVMVVRLMDNMRRGNRQVLPPRTT